MSELIGLKAYKSFIPTSPLVPPPTSPRCPTFGADSPFANRDQNYFLSYLGGGIEKRRFQWRLQLKRRKDH